MKKQLAIVKFNIEQEEEVDSLLDVLRSYENDYSVSLVLFEREGAPLCCNYPIFCGLDLVEFHCPVIFCDIESTKFAHLCPSRNKYYLPISHEFGRASIDEKSTEEINKLLEAL